MPNPTGNHEAGIPIGKAIRTKTDVLAYLFLGGWGDGWDLLHAGAVIHPAAIEGGLIRFWVGPEPPGPPSVGRPGGLIPASQFPDFEDYKD